jgi:hypothetical protein
MQPQPDQTIAAYIGLLCHLARLSMNSKTDAAATVRK